MILTIPVKRGCVRRNGADVPVLELVPGFVRLLADDVADNAAAGNQEILISNPLIEAFINAPTTSIGVGERVFVVLDEQPASDPGLNDNGPSLIHNAHSLT